MAYKPYVQKSCLKDSYKEFEHFEAKYYMPGGEERRVRVQELSSATVREFLSTKELFTTDGTERRLFVRAGSLTPHFYCREKSLQENLTRPENDPLHNKRRDEVAEIANNSNSFDVGYYYWEDQANSKGSRAPGFETFFKMTEYKFDTEEKYDLSQKAFCRFDVLGRKNKPGLTWSYPMLALEIINFHFPLQKTFEAWLAFTKTTPCVIAFDHAKKKNLLFKKYDREKRIRVVFYIFKGKVWKNDKEIPDCTYQDFERLIKEFIARQDAKDLTKSI